MMTRKNFEAIANVLDLSRAELHADGLNDHVETIEYIASDLAAVFADDNPNFDRDRFMKACGF